MQRTHYLVLLSAIFAGHWAEAHTGRGFEIEVSQGKLQAQGVNNGPNDGAPAVRPYLNSIHDHWSVYIEQFDRSFTTFPEFEVTPQVAATFLASYRLDLELTGAWQWVDPPSDPAPLPPTTTPLLRPLDPGEVISVQTLGSPVTTETLGTVALSQSVPATGTGDVVPSYSIPGTPAGEIHVLEFVLSATPPDGTLPAFESSDPLYVILSPPGTGPVERLHFASLYLEQHLAANGVTIVPEPGPLALSLWAGALLPLARRRRA